MLKKQKTKQTLKAIGIDLNDLSKDRPWMPDGTNYLIDLYKLGWTVNEIAEEMNRTPGDIAGKIYDLGEAGKLIPEMWGADNKSKQFPMGPLGDIAVVIPLLQGG